MTPLEKMVDRMTDAYALIERVGAKVARVQLRPEVAAIILNPHETELWDAQIEVVDALDVGAVLWAEPNGLDPFTDPYPDGLRIG